MPLNVTVLELQVKVPELLQSPSIFMIAEPVATRVPCMLTVCATRVSEVPIVKVLPESTSNMAVELALFTVSVVPLT